MPFVYNSIDLQLANRLATCTGLEIPGLQTPNMGLTPHGTHTTLVLQDMGLTPQQLPTVFALTEYDIGGRQIVSHSYCE